ncbi:MAG: alpha/beta fold hydrolase [Actinomycetota bacterium]
MSVERVSFYADCVEPVRLEGILEMPEDAQMPPACILCHPHPIGGGSMYVPLLETMAQDLVSRGWACLRFNFRGVGLSSGVSTGGICEVEDVEGAYRYLLERPDLDGADPAVAGWSFGAWIGLRWAVRGRRTSRIALVSPPMVGFDFFYFLDEEGALPPQDALIVSGARDQFNDLTKLRELSLRLGADLRILEGADHFLFGREKEIAAIVAQHWS